MAKQATINPTQDQLILRNIGRIKTLRTSIEKHAARGNAEKVAQLQTELDRRVAQIDAVRAQLDAL